MDRQDKRKSGGVEEKKKRKEIEKKTGKAEMSKDGENEKREMYRDQRRKGIGT